MPRRSVAQTATSRRNILGRAIDLASVEGLEGLTIGRLADSLKMSKSGLFAHFGSKQDLQLAVVNAAAAAFEEAVTVTEEAGLARLRDLAGAWLRHLETGASRGGCFFAAASLEFDDRPGRVRDRICELTASWMAELQKAATEACEDGDLDGDPEQIAFEIHAFLQEANWSFQLHGNAAAFERATAAIGRILEAGRAAAGR